MNRALKTCAALASLAMAMSAAAQTTTTKAIKGVLGEATPVVLVRDGFKAVEGPLAQPDGGLLFGDNQSNQIVRIAPDGTVSSWFDNSGGANALTRTPAGDIVATLVGDKVVAVMKPGSPPRPLVNGYNGTPFNRPNDLVASRRGDIYFTDTAAAGATAPALPSALYQITDKGELLRITTDIARPNGVALSPDDGTLYVANTAGEYIIAFNLDRKGRVGKRRDFAQLAMPPPQNGAPASSGADGIAVDEEGRLYVATTLGVQVFSSKGKPLGTIEMPKQPQNLAFAGPGRTSLYVVGRGAVYRISTLTHGVDREGK
jgi:gluconolactonase